MSKRYPLYQVSCQKNLWLIFRFPQYNRQTINVKNLLRAFHIGNAAACDNPENDTVILSYPHEIRVLVNHEHSLVYVPIKCKQKLTHRCLENIETMLKNFANNATAC